MNFEPLLNASLAVQLHVAFALIAIFLGAYVLWARKRGWHKHMGRFWVLVMVLVAMTSFFIHGIRMVGPFSPIHILSIITLVGLWRAVSAVRSGRIAQHKSAMKSLFFGALIIPGLLNFIPGRTMYEVFFGRLGMFWAENGPLPIVNITLGFSAFLLMLSVIYYRHYRRG